MACPRHPLERPNRRRGVTQSAGPPPSRLEDLGLDDRVVSMLREDWSIEELFPPQAEALPHALSGRNVMLTIPTASGKSLVAYLAIVHRLTSDLEGARALYVVPLKALASEKARELRDIASSVGLRVGLAIGDREGETGMLEEADILVCTSEKLDSLLRTRSELIDRVGIVVSDEFHLLHDPGRGPTLEVLLSRIRHSRPEAQIIALSATVGNADEMAEWLDSELVVSEWRPVTLRYGTLTGLEAKVHRVDGQGTEEAPEARALEGKTTRPLQAILQDTIRNEGQLLVFVSSRASAQKEARELSKHIRHMLVDGGLDVSQDVIDRWEGIAAGLLGRGEASASVSSLATSLRGGVAFHHAGLTGRHRGVVEDSFRSGDLFCVVATPTLAQGVNLPARTVVVRDYRRWSAAAGMTMPLPILEVLQMMGRAGRPKYDDVGDAWLLAKGRDEEVRLVDLYLHGKPEEVTSKLANPNALRAEEDPALLTHVLSMIATGGTTDRDALGRFFSKTFLATQLDSESLASRIDDVVSWLASNGMVDRLGESDEVKARILEEPPVEQPEEWEDEMPSWVDSATEVKGLDVASEPIRRNGERPRRGPPIFGFRKASMHDSFEADPPESASMSYSATNLGERVAQLYLNPISGRIIRDGLAKAMATLTGEDDYGQVSPLSLLHLVSCTPDFLPLWPRKGDYDAIQAALHGHEREFLAQAVDLDEERRMKGVLVLQSWAEEARVERIEKDWGVQPGDLRGRVELAEWLLYATRRILAEDEELSSMSSNAHRTLVEAIDEIHRRVRYGCKADLLGLVALRGVGRARARQMVDLLGVSNAADVAALTERDMQKLSDLRGWSPRLVDGLVATAGRAIRRGSG